MVSCGWGVGWCSIVWLIGGAAPVLRSLTDAARGRGRAVAEGVAYLSVVTQPSNTSLGGAPFARQPCVAATLLDGTVDHSISAGWVATAELIATPNRFAVLRNGTSVPFVGGYANFTGLLVNEAGHGYIIRIIAHSFMVETAAFNVAVGPAAQVALGKQPGAAYGGTAFAPQPEVRLQDLGGNLVAIHEPINVSVAIVAAPAGGGRLSGGAVMVAMFKGTAAFRGLAIDVAGHPYRLRFTTTTTSVQKPWVESVNFTVGIGPVARLTVVTHPAGAYGGAAFVVQPAVVLRDAGGNVLVNDNVTRVNVSFARNEYGATLAPAFIRTVLPIRASIVQGSNFVAVTGDPNLYLGSGDLVELAPVRVDDLFQIVDQPVQVRLVYLAADLRLRLQLPWAGASNASASVTRLVPALDARVTRGVATFARLRLDVAGPEYALRFTVAHDAAVTVDTIVFPVFVGPPHSLRVVAPVGNAWFGGQPFGQQPVISVVDAGGNWLRNVTGMTVTASLDTAFNNASNATLVGHNTAVVERGIAEFDDLEVSRPGKNYRMRFLSSSGIFNTVCYFDVVYSAEWQLMSSSAMPGDNFAWSLAADGGRIVSGAPDTHFPVHEVQTINTRGSRVRAVPLVILTCVGLRNPRAGSASSFVNEVQIVETSAVHLDEVQVISICASSGVVGGGFSMYFAGPDETRFIPFDSDIDFMKVRLSTAHAVAAVV